jgi:hypothetical protein
MAVLTAKGIASLNIELLTRSLVLPMTVARIPGGDYSGPNGGTITVRVPQPGASRTQTNPGDTITYDDVTEIPVDVTLSHLYHGKLVSDQELTYSIEDFGRQISRVQVDAVATGAEDKLAAVMNALSSDAALDATASDDDTKEIVLAAREFLTESNAPSSNRWLAASPQVITRLLQVDEFVRVDASGSNNALRNAVVGRIFGMNVVESNALDSGEAVAYHESGFAFANRTPVTPRGAVDSAAVTEQGIGLRHIFQYVPDKLSDASVVSTFAGAAAVYEDGTGTDGSTRKRFFKITTDAS